GISDPLAAITGTFRGTAVQATGVSSSNMGSPTTLLATVQDCGMTNYSPLLAIFVLAPRLRRASNRAVSIYLPARSEGYDPRFYDIEFRDLLHRYKNR